MESHTISSQLLVCVKQGDFIFLFLEFNPAKIKAEKHLFKIFFCPVILFFYIFNHLATLASATSEFLRFVHFQKVTIYLLLKDLPIQELHH